jgi:hypothetical protein
MLAERLQFELDYCPHGAAGRLRCVALASWACRRAIGEHRPVTPEVEVRVPSLPSLTVLQSEPSRMTRSIAPRDPGSIRAAGPKRPRVAIRSPPDPWNGRSHRSAPGSHPAVNVFDLEAVVIGGAIGSRLGAPYAKRIERDASASLPARTTSGSERLGARRPRRRDLRDSARSRLGSRLEHRRAGTVTMTFRTWPRLEEMEPEGVLRWRFTQLLGAGYSPDDALELAVHTESIFTSPLTFAGAACPAETAKKVLS